MKYEALWNPNYTGWRKEQVQPDYFGRYVYPLVESKLENEFTIEDFMNKFNTLNPKVRTTNYFSSFKHVITLHPNYYYHYKLISVCLNFLVKEGKLNVRWVSVGSRTEPIFTNFYKKIT